MEKSLYLLDLLLTLAIRTMPDTFGISHFIQALFLKQVLHENDCRPVSSSVLLFVEKKGNLKIPDISSIVNWGSWDILFLKYTEEHQI